MELLDKQGTQLAPKDSAEAVAIFRAQVIGPLLTRAFTAHGELASAIAALSRVRHRSPNAGTTRTYSQATIERWYYRFKKRGLPGITPLRRSDIGHARELTGEQRELLLAIRREHPTTSAALILRTLELDGRLAKGVVSLHCAGSTTSTAWTARHCASPMAACDCAGKPIARTRYGTPTSVTDLR
jgi:putative transposase